MIAFFAKLVIGLVGAILLIDKLRGARRIDRAFLTEAVFTMFSAFAFIMVAAAIYALIGGPARRFGIGGVLLQMLFLVSYAGFAALWLARMAPKARPLPAFIGTRFGLADIVALTPGVLVVIGLVLFGGDG